MPGERMYNFCEQLSKLYNIGKEYGWGYVLQKCIETIFRKTIGPNLPRRVVNYSEVNVKAGRLFDQHIPGVKSDRPNYESGLVRGLQQETAEGNKIVIVGGGWGVTSVIASNLSGPTGKVTVYEAGKNQIHRIKNTLKINEHADNIELNHSVIGDPLEVRGEMGSPEYLSPKELPDCDLLELDCEGTELEILRDMNCNPNTILVETHGMLGSPTEEVKAVLEKRGYYIDNIIIADEEIPWFCEDKDIKVITAKKE